MRLAFAACAAVLAAAFAAGCAGAPVMPRRADGAAYSVPDLSFGVHWMADHESSPWAAEHIAAASGLRTAGLDDERSAAVRGVDVIVRIDYHGRGFGGGDAAVDTLSAATGKVLSTARIPWAHSDPWSPIAAHLLQTYAPDGALFAQVKGRPAAAAVPSPVATAGEPTRSAGPAVSDVDVPAFHSASRPDDFALVVGIEEYQGVPRADYGVRDAQAVRRNLEALGFPPRNIISLEGSQATGNKLKSYLEEWLPLNVKPESTLFVYYSGHGAPDAKTGDAYLVPWDGDPKFLKSTALPLKTFYADLARTKAKRVIVALDACFSGAGGRSVLAQGARPLVSRVTQAAPAAGNLVVLAAASGDEIAGPANDQRHGLFTYHLLKGMAAAPNGTARELFEYLKPRVQDDARRDNREQTPVLLGAAETPLAR